MADDKIGMLKGLTLISQVGLVMIIPIIGAIYLGNYLDQRFNTNNVFLIIFIILGVMSGFMNVYKMIMRGTRKK